MKPAAAILLAAALTLAAGPGPGRANDSTAELRTNGLVLVPTEAVVMASEDLFISEREIRVDYVFRNESDRDLTTIVAFPMPEIEGNPFVNTAIPLTADNFLGFTVTVDGAPVEPRLQQRASVLGIDVTDEIVARGLPLLPFGEATWTAADALPDAVKADWTRRGLLIREEYDAGAGMEVHHAPIWTLRSVYWWEMTFPAGRDVKVAHRYTPSVGSTVGLTFLEDGRLAGEGFNDYARRYCMDDAFSRAVEKSIPADDPYGSPFFEKRIAYVLTTGRNWAGAIGRFRLTIDKGRPDNLVSFCGSGVKKTGPTTFTMEAEDFWPERDLEVLILERP